MDDVAPSTTTDVKPRAGCWFFLLPVGVAILTIAAYIVLLLVGSFGTEADGDRLALEYQACSDAQGVVAERVLAMGLGEPVYESTPTGFVATVTLPDVPGSNDSIPVTLTKRGALEVYPKDTAPGSTEPIVTSAQVKSAAVSLEQLGNPLTLVELDETGTKALAKHMVANPTASVSMWMDGEEIEVRPNEPAILNGQLSLYPKAADAQKNLELAAERSIVLGAGPLPCDVTLAGKRVVTPKP